MTRDHDGMWYVQEIANDNTRIGQTMTLFHYVFRGSLRSRAEKIAYLISDPDVSSFYSETERAWCKCSHCGRRIQVVRTIRPDLVCVTSWILHKLRCRELQ